MRASEFQQLNERKLPQKRRVNRPVSTQYKPAAAVQPPASIATSAPATAPVQAPVATPTQAPVQAPVSNSPSALDKIKQKMYSAGQGVANRFTTQGRATRKAATAQKKTSLLTDKIFIDKFIKDMKSEEQMMTGLRGQPFDARAWVKKYLLKNRWDVGNQSLALSRALQTNDKLQIAKVVASIGKYNNLGTTIDAKAAAKAAASAVPKAPVAPVAPVAPPTTARVAPPRKPGLPSSEEEAKFQQRLQQAAQQQGKA